MRIKDRLGKERLFFDGAMGTMLQEAGLAAGELPEIWNMTRPDAVYNIHKAYADIGCDILSANTFGANRLKMAGTGYTVQEVVGKAVEIARKAARESGAYVALDIGPTGKLLAPFGDLAFDEAVGIFAGIISAGAGADLVIIETMGDTYEIKAAMLAAKENCDLPLFVLFTPDENGRLFTGGDIQSAVCMIEGMGADAVGINCGLGPEKMKALVPELARCASIPLAVMPNAGIPELIDGRSVFNVEAEEFAAIMAEIAKTAHIVGGCCGTAPRHIEALIKACKGIAPPVITPKKHTVVSSYGKAVVLGKGTVIIGERINPTGKPRMKQALKENDMAYICREGLNQIERGAEILDVNAGMPGIDEAEMLSKAVLALQGVTDAPLQIDTADAKAAERALRLYNGKPLLNSVNGKKESLETILPLAKKYGAALVALALDDAGIPETAEGRVQIAKRIIAAAESHGIPQKDIIVDALTMTVSTGGSNARVTLEAMERVRGELGVHTVLGVSNVSFGLPERERANAAFFTLAMERGLSAGIVNPMNAAMMDAYYTYRALNGQDANCGEYIARFSQPSESKSAEAAPARAVPARSNNDTEASLYDAVLKGLRAQAVKAAEALLKSEAPLEIINARLIPALDKVGADFERGVLFLPQLLMSAEAAKSAFEVLKAHLSQKGEAQEKRGKVVLATVKGDIHDIGKNIVKVLLENYNFQVIDLGKNVEPELVVEAVLAESAGLAGLSALMTTTLAYMEETVRLLKERAPQCRIMVGGAVLTQDYADKMRADFYSKDAMGGVRFAERVFG